LGSLRSNPAGFRGDLGTVRLDLEVVRGNLANISIEPAAVRGDLASFRSNRANVCSNPAYVRVDPETVRPDLNDVTGDSDTVIALHFAVTAHLSSVSTVPLDVSRHLSTGSDLPVGIACRSNRVIGDYFSVTGHRCIVTGHSTVVRGDRFICSAVFRRLAIIAGAFVSIALLHGPETGNVRSDSANSHFGETRRMSQNFTPVGESGRRREI
jgi:hypothetical protein